MIIIERTHTLKNLLKKKKIKALKIEQPVFFFNSKTKENKMLNNLTKNWSLILILTFTLICVSVRRRFTSMEKTHPPHLPTTTHTIKNNNNQNQNQN